MEKFTDSLLLFFSPTPLSGFFIENQIDIAAECIISTGLSKWHKPSHNSCKAALKDSQGQVKQDIKKYVAYADELEYRLAIENWTRVFSKPTHFGIEELYKNLRSIFNKKDLASEDLIKSLYPCFPESFNQIADIDSHNSCNQAFSDLVVRSL